MSLIVTGSRNVLVPYAEDYNATTSNVNLGVRQNIPNGTDQQTWLVYARRDGDGEGNFGHLFGRTASAGQGYRVYDDVSGGKTWWTLNSNVPGYPRLSANRRLSLGEWEHIAVTSQGTIYYFDMAIYLGAPGVPLYEATYSDSLNGNTAVSDMSTYPLLIGNRNGTDRTWNGLIAYSACWERILQLSELRHAQANGPLSVPEGLVLCWSGGRDWSVNGFKPESTTAIGFGGGCPNPRLGPVGGRRL